MISRRPSQGQLQVSASSFYTLSHSPETPSSHLPSVGRTFPRSKITEDYKYLPPPPDPFPPHSHHHHYFLPLPGTISHTLHRGLQISSSAFNPLSPILSQTTPFPSAICYQNRALYLPRPSPSQPRLRVYFQDADLTPISDLPATNQASSQGRASESIPPTDTSLSVSIKLAPIFETSATPALQ